MTSKYEIEERVIERAMATYPAIPQIVEFSTPVVSFGYPKTAKVATLGINPSSNEFQIGNGNKNPLPSSKKRLVDTEVLGVSKPLGLNRAAAIQVIEGCYSYFKNNPYEWFDDLQQYALTPTGTSFQNGSACHLDIVQWATDPVWQDKKMPKNIKKLLLDSDKEFLKYQLTAYDFSYIFLNGSTVLDQVEKLDLVSLEQVGQVRFNQTGTKSRIVAGQLGSKRFIGWGINAGYGASYKPGLEDLANWLKNNVGNIN
jgi:hypothetical protein